MKPNKHAKKLAHAEAAFPDFSLIGHRNNIYSDDAPLGQNVRHSRLLGRYFGLINGWELKRDTDRFCLHHFSAEAIPDVCHCDEHLHFDIMDHSLKFVDATYPHAPAAIVGQPYGHSDYADTLAGIKKKYGLVPQTPPARFAGLHFPGNCLFFVFTHPWVRVIWLPEQTDMDGPFMPRS